LSLSQRREAEGVFRLEWTFLGQLAYEPGLRLQRAWAEQVAAGAAGRLFLLEHPPTVTLGRHADPANLLLSAEEYQRRGMTVHRVERGGDVTYHGPGQLVGYPVVSIRRAGMGAAAWVEGVAQVLIEFLADLGIQANWSNEQPGVWVDGAKVAAVGFHIARGISTHGFALNLEPDLAAFDTIVPCGLMGKRVTSVAAQLGRAPDMEWTARELAAGLAARFGWCLEAQLPAETVQPERMQDLAASA
jgi:lipoate-protein ligase B